MNWLDIVLLIVFVVAVFQGMRAGLIKSLIGLAGLILGLILALRYYGTLGSWLGNYISNPSVASVVGFVIILAGMALLASVVGSLLGGLVSAIGLGLLNRLGGAVFSLAMAALSAGLLLAALLQFPFSQGLENTIRDSFIARLLIDRMPFVLGLLPSEFDSLRGFFQ